MFLLAWQSRRTAPYELRLQTNAVLYAIRLDGSENRRVNSEEEGGWSGRISPDGKTIAYVSGAVNVIDYDGRGRREIVRGDATSCVGELCWSPDSKYLAVLFDTGKQEWRGMAWTSGGRIDIYDLSGQRLRSFQRQTTLI